MSFLKKLKKRIKEPSSQAGAGVIVLALSAAFPAYSQLILGAAGLLGIGAIATPEGTQEQP